MVKTKPRGWCDWIKNIVSRGLNLELIKEIEKAGSTMPASSIFKSTWFVTISVVFGIVRFLFRLLNFVL